MLQEQAIDHQLQQDNLHLQEAQRLTQEAIQVYLLLESEEQELSLQLEVLQTQIKKKIVVHVALLQEAVEVGK
jgi:hypothetical protein